MALAATLAIAQAWPFDRPREASVDAPLWEVLVYHGTVLGFLRLALVVLALYAIASAPALIAGGRWLQGFGTTGLTADAATFGRELDEVEDEIALLRREYAAVLRLNREYRTLLEERRRLD